MADSEYLVEHIDKITHPLSELCESENTALRTAVALRLVQTASHRVPNSFKPHFLRFVHKCSRTQNNSAGEYEPVIGALDKWAESFESYHCVSIRQCIARKILETAIALLPADSKECDGLVKLTEQLCPKRQVSVRQNEETLISCIDDILKKHNNDSPSADNSKEKARLVRMCKQDPFVRNLVSYSCVLKYGLTNGDTEKLRKRVDSIVSAYRHNRIQTGRKYSAGAATLDVSVRRSRCRTKTCLGIIRDVIKAETGLEGIALTREARIFINKYGKDPVMRRWISKNSNNIPRYIEDKVRFYVSSKYDSDNHGSLYGFMGYSNKFADFVSSVIQETGSVKNGKFVTFARVLSEEWIERNDVRTFVRNGRVINPDKLKPLLTDLLISEQAKLDPEAPPRHMFERKYFSIDEIRGILGVNDIVQYKEFRHLLGEPKHIMSNPPRTAYPGVNVYHFVVAVRSARTNECTRSISDRALLS